MGTQSLRILYHIWYLPSPFHKIDHTHHAITDIDYEIQIKGHISPMSKTIKCQKSMKPCRSTLCPLSNAITTAYNLSTDFNTVNVQTLIGILDRVPTEKVLRRILGRIWLDSWKVIAIIMHNIKWGNRARRWHVRCVHACGYICNPCHVMTSAVRMRFWDGIGLVNNSSRVERASFNLKWIWSNPCVRTCAHSHCK